MILHAVVFVMLAGLAASEFDPELHAKYLTMSKSSFIEYFNAQNYSWKIADTDNIEAKKFTNCEYADLEFIESLPFLIHDLEAIDLPDKFDARDKWPQCETINEIYNQGMCGSCWVFGSVTSASDRICIHKDEHIRLSVQDLECFQKRVCDGGFSGNVFKFWQDEGIVTDACKPYNIPELRENKCVTKCVKPEMDYKQDKRFGERFYQIANNSDQIKAELVKNGPIQAGFNVYTDFKDYKSGIYIHKFGSFTGSRHSVRIIGYGVEDGMEYWLVTNSWGANWGDHGLFKIKSFQEEIEFENLMHAGLPKN